MGLAAFNRARRLAKEREEQAKQEAEKKAKKVKAKAAPKTEKSKPKEDVAGLDAMLKGDEATAPEASTEAKEA